MAKHRKDCILFHIKFTTGEYDFHDHVTKKDSYYYRNVPIDHEEQAVASSLGV